MKLHAPIYRLKRQARILSRKESIPLHNALDRIAEQEGFRSWSLLALHFSSTAIAEKIYAQLNPGDIVLVAARPGQGKTLLSLEIAVEAMKAGHRSSFFSLEFTIKDCQESFESLGADMSNFKDLFEFDGCDEISSDHIERKLSGAPFGTVAVIDYLQLLDQKRDSPDLVTQMTKLKTYARQHGLTMLFISQIDRSFDSTIKAFPDLTDVRLPNPLDLTLFDKACFLNNGEIDFKIANQAGER